MIISLRLHWSSLCTLLFSHPVVSNSLWPHGLQHARPACPSHLPEFAQVHVHCIGDAIQPSNPLMPSCPSALNLFQHQGLLQWVICSHEMAKILVLQLQHQFFKWIFRFYLPWDWLVWSSCCPGDFHESSPAPQFKGINFLVLCLLYDPILITIHDHWKDHSLIYKDLCQQSNVSAFQHSLGLS